MYQYFAVYCANGLCVGDPRFTLSATVTEVCIFAQGVVCKGGEFKWVGPTPPSPTQSQRPVCEGVQGGCKVWHVFVWMYGPSGPQAKRYH